MTISELCNDKIKYMSNEEIDDAALLLAKTLLCKNCPIQEATNCGTAPKRNANTIDIGCCYWQWRDYLYDLRKWGASDDS